MILLDIEVDSVDEARFWIWVDKTESCWNWEGRKSKLGYGRFGIRGGERAAHRISWVIAHGPIGGDLRIDHMCHNASCVNPEHLRLATAKQNAENLLPVNASSGYRGVYRYGKHRWIGGLRHAGMDYRTSAYDDPAEANEAIKALRNKLFTHNVLDRTPS